MLISLSGTPSSVTPLVPLSMDRLTFSSVDSAVTSARNIPRPPTLPDKLVVPAGGAGAAAPAAAGAESVNSLLVSVKVLPGVTRSVSIL